MKINESALVIGKLIIACRLIALRSDSLLQDVFCFHYSAGQGRGGRAHLSSEGGAKVHNRERRCLSVRKASVSTTLDLKRFTKGSCADNL